MADIGNVLGAAMNAQQLQGALGQSFMQAGQPHAGMQQPEPENLTKLGFKKLKKNKTNPEFTNFLGLKKNATNKLAYRTLLDIIRQQGSTDKAAFNSQLAGIMQGGQQRQTDALGGLEASGFGRSGLGQALLAAIGQGTENRIFQATAEEQQRKEQRMRDDLGLFLQLVLNPAQSAKELKIAKRGQDKQMAADITGAALGAAGMGFGAFGGS